MTIRDMVVLCHIGRVGRREDKHWRDPRPGVREMVLLIADC